MINDEDVVAVRSATNIVGVISQYVQLKRVGRRWSGLCPFHQEKTPSFSVNEEAGLFYCFGCQKSGDAITFLRELEGLDFVGAVERLAAKANLSLRYTDADAGESRRRRHRLSDAVERAVDWYHERLLVSPDAGVARGYLRSRGIDGDEVRRFRLGWAPEGWDELARVLRLSEQDWRDSGLGLINRRGRQQDFFRARILFPIFDPQGAAIGFGGRKLDGADGPKYLNPTGTPIYDKSKVLYGLSAAKADIVTVQEAIVCEGYTDVIGFFRAGMSRAVATCGTALTEDHVKLLTRFAKRLVLAFDADGAGQAAAERFHQWEQAYELDVAVANLPAGVDPADLALHDPEALRRAVAEALPFLAFRLQRLFGSADLRTAEGRARAAKAALVVIGQHPDPLVRDQYLLEVSSRCRIDAAQLRQLGTPASGAGRRSDAGRVDAADRDGPGSSRSGRRAEDGSPVARRPVGVVKAHRYPRDDSLPMDALRCAVADADRAADWLDPVLFASGPYRRAVELLFSWPTVHEALDAADGADEEAAALLRLALAEGPTSSLEGVFVRLCHNAAVRALHDLSTQAMTSADAREVIRQSTFVGSLLGVLDDANVPDHSETKLEAGTDLLAWLLEPGEGTR